MISVPDRIDYLIRQTEVTGVDFISVDQFTQTNIAVHFLLAPDAVDPKLTIGPAAFTDMRKIRIYNPAGDVPDKEVIHLEWLDDVLHLTVDSPGDFTLYKLFINDPRLDPYYNDVTFDFKAGCPSDLDCKPPEHECMPDERVDFPVDYLARDFSSYRQALLEFAAARYPQWPDRLEADAGVMLTEIMSAMGDEMAYYQDRVAREAYLESATQRRSLRRHARLVDYTLHDGLGAFAWLNIATGTYGDIPAGTGIHAKSESGMMIDFETGKYTGRRFSGQVHYTVDPALNKLNPHIWDEDDTCLPVGSTQIYVDGNYAAEGPPEEGKLNFDDPATDRTGKWVLLQTKPKNLAQPARSHLVRVTLIENATDPVFNATDPAFNRAVTRLSWSEEYATPFEMDMTVLGIYCNIIPATAGLTHTAYFITGGDYENDFSDEQRAALYLLNKLADPPLAVERRGRKITTPDDKEADALIYLYTLPGTEEQSIVRAGHDPSTAMPEIRLQQMIFQAGAWVDGDVWDYTTSFTGIDAADPGDACFSLDDGAWRRVAGYQRPGKEIIHRDYASGNGATIRFGDGEFGLTPVTNTVFKVQYRLGNGSLDNVSTDTLTTIDRVPVIASLAVTNPFPADKGTDPQTLDELRQLAPEAFRALTYRAVRPEDYAEAAERLPWVQRAGAAFRWTGSWLSAFVTPDPKNTVVLAENKKTELLDHLNRFRQAGKKVHVMDPVYANIDIEIEVCAASNAFPGEVKERVIEVLLGKKTLVSHPGYFSADHFTFGTPLYRSTLEAAIQNVPGVRAVENISFRRRGWFDWKVFDGFDYSPGINGIIRVENNRLHPERGSLKINIHGGA